MVVVVVEDVAAVTVAAVTAVAEVEVAAVVAWGEVTLNMMPLLLAVAVETAVVTVVAMAARPLERSREASASASNESAASLSLMVCADNSAIVGRRGGAMHTQPVCSVVPEGLHNRHDTAPKAPFLHVALCECICR